MCSVGLSQSKVAAILLLLILFTGAATATDYYVATWGDNSSAGTSLDTAWRNIQYGFETMKAGDTLYVVDGTYHESPVGTYKAAISGELFDHNANETHQVTITAYNGTPTIGNYSGEIIIGILLKDDDYINIDGIKITGINSSFELDRGILSRDGSENCNFTNITVDFGGTGIYLYQNANNTIIENCTVLNSSWNSIMISNNVLARDTMHNISVLNCNIHGTQGHGGIDLVDNLTAVSLIGNTISNVTDAVFTHGNAELDYRFDDFSIQSNKIYENNTNGIVAAHTLNWNISNNTIYYHQIEVSDAENTNVSQNTIYCADNYDYIRINGDNHTLYSNLFIGTGQRRLVTDGNANIINPRGTLPNINIIDNSTAEIKFLDGKVFAKTGFYTDANTTCSAIEYFPDCSNFSLTSVGPSGDISGTLTLYNITISPTNAYLKNVTVNRASNATYDITNITINSSETTNPTWINSTMQNSSDNYSISVDGAIIAYTNASNGIVSYRYISSWSEHDFEFSWTSAAPFSPNNSKIYYNATLPILNTVNSFVVMWNRTLTAADTELATSLVVTT